MANGLRSTIVPLLVLSAGLVGLGVLEYRWTEGLARAERDRLRAGMSAAAVRFADDLDRELRQLLFAFRPTPWSAADDPAGYARQRDEWAAQATDPGLLRAVLVADDGGEEWSLRRIDGATFVPTPWTPDLEPVRQRLTTAHTPDGGPGPSPLVPEVPALVVGTRPPQPRPSAPPEAFPPRPRGPHANPAGAWPAPPPPMHMGGAGLSHEAPAPASAVILLLDPEVLRARLLAALAARHFAGLDCDLAVVARAGGGGVIWTTRPGFPDAHARADAVAALLSTPPFAAGRHAGGSWPPVGPHAAPPWRTDAPFGPPPTSREPHDRPGSGAWQLLVAHRSGSLETAVARTRARNLGIGLGVLVLLGGSAALLALSAHRAQALARQQVAFVAGVSHELRTPLAAIRAAGENLADGVVTDPEGIRRYGAVIRQAGERLTALVERTLELSGMLGGGRSLQLVEVDVAALVKEVLVELDPGGRVTVDVPDGLPAIVGDRAALRSALANLVDNALKHGEGEGVVVRARMAAAPTRDAVALAVEDRGPGVAGEKPARLFAPFYRGARARGQRVPGSGLGLSVVRQVMEAHGGRVSVGFGPDGRGAVFTLHLPVAPREPRA